MKKLVIGILIIICSPFSSVYGGWTGPSVVVVGAWGNEIGQFGFASYETADAFPREFGIDNAGVISIADLLNQRIQIFTADGSLQRVISKPADLKVSMWPKSLIVLPIGNASVR